jgi:hypothetical protein
MHFVPEWARTKPYRITLITLIYTDQKSSIPGHFKFVNPRHPCPFRE